MSERAAGNSTLGSLFSGYGGLDLAISSVLNTLDQPCHVDVLLELADCPRSAC